MRNADPVSSRLAFKAGKLEKKRSGRGERIRTSDTCVPNAVLYQAELHPDFSLSRTNPNAFQRSRLIAKDSKCIREFRCSESARVCAALMPASTSR